MNQPRFPLGRESGLPREGQGSGKFPGGPSEVWAEVRTGVSFHEGSGGRVERARRGPALGGHVERPLSGPRLPARPAWRVSPSPRVGMCRDREWGVIQPGRGSEGGRGGKGRGRPRVGPAQGLKSPAEEPAADATEPRCSIPSPRRSRNRTEASC